MAIYDVSVPLRPEMPTYAGEPGPHLDYLKRIANGDSANVTSLSLGSHTGTHVDARHHFLDGRSTVEAMPVDALVGPAAVVERRFVLVGIDYLSIEQFRSPTHEVHKALLEAGVIIVEGLDLRNVPAGAYTLVCAPLKVVGADGAPARVFLWD